MKMKSLLFVIGCAITLECSAQSSTYVGRSKIYMFPDWGDKYAAKVYDWTGDGVINTYYFSTINLYEDGIFNSYSSSHGKYIAFNYLYYIMTGLYDSCEQVIFKTYTRNGSGYYAFVIAGNKLQIVDVKTDVIISTLETNFTKYDDFSITVEEKSRISDRNKPSFWIVNNGYVKIYDGFPPATSVNNIPTENVPSGIKYNLNGTVTNNPKDEIYIQDGKKYIAK